MLENGKRWQSIGCFIAACAIAVLTPILACGDISLPRIFSDHMVLQQKSEVEIWGLAEANEEVEIRFDEQSVAVTADANGDWKGFIRTPEAGGPYQLEVKSKKGVAKVVLNDVMIGEVWICGGQNNMEFPVANALNAEAEIEKAKDFPALRLFTVGHNISTERFTDLAKADGWNVCTPDSIAQFSAVAYFFGRQLNESLEVPIGLIHCSKAGTACEAWTSREALEGKPELAELLKHWDQTDDPTDHDRPGNLFNGMIAPLKGVKFRGFAWYQGESNVGRGKQYATLLPLLINSWRKEFANETAPFLFVQLAPHRYDQRDPSALAELQDAQLKTLRNTPFTGLIGTNDLAEVDNLEPKNKQEIGRRMAVWAFSNVYPVALNDKEIQPPSVFSGPVFQSMETVEGTNQIKINFDHVGDGLECREGKELNQFLICGSDQKFVPATAIIDGKSVLVSSQEVAEPVAVRFSWDDSAIPNLFNSAGLPAIPFRTDNFKLLSEEVHF